MHIDSLVDFPYNREYSGLAFVIIAGENTMITKGVPETAEVTAVREFNEVDISKISSPVLAELIEEVRNEKVTMATQVYDRTHNRHNRGR